MGTIGVSRVRVTALLVVASAVGVYFAAAFSNAVLAGDALDYRGLMVEMFSGKVPFVDMAFPHLPLMVVPMALAWLVGGNQDLQTYAFALAGVSTAIIVATGLIIRRIERGLAIEDLTVRWILLTVPVLPFLLFRNDSWVVFLALAGILLAMNGKKVASALVLGAGCLAKGWPGLWGVVEWKRGNRWVAVAVAAFTLASFAVLLSPQLQAAQDSRGTHTETLAGSVTGLVRSIGGSDLRLERSAATYIDGPWWLLAVNVAFGGLIGLSAWRGLRHQFDWARSWRLMGGLTAALIIASPFFSTQYVAWLSPFAAVDRRATVMMLPVNTFSLILLTSWQEMFEGRVWWWALLVLRNLLFIMVGLYLATSSGASASSPVRPGRLSNAAGRGL
jgi:hypothetical protein